MTPSAFLDSLSYEQTIALAEHCATARRDYERIVSERNDAISELIKSEDFNRKLAATFSVSE